MTRSFIAGAWLAIATTSAALSGAAFADDPSRCKEAAGTLSVVNNGDGTTSGTVTHGGRLNGTSRAVFTSSLMSTPNPGAFSYTDEFSIATDRGVLKAHNLGLFMVDKGLFSEIAVIDPAASTGRFATATGVLYVNGNTKDGGASFKAEISGEVCGAD